MINYKGTPILGPDSSTKNTSEFFAFAGTVLFWIIFLIFSFVIKPQPKKPEYKEVQIVLSSTPVVQKSEEAPAPAEQAAASSASSEPVAAEVVETPAPAPKPDPVQKTVETPAAKKVETPKPKAQTPPKKEPAKTQPAQKPVEKPAAVQKPAEPVQYAVDPMEAFANQTKQQPKKAVDWDAMFGDDEAEDTSSSSQVKTVQNNTPAFSGSAATAATSSEQKVTSSSSSNNSKSQAASSSTSSALQGIKNSTFRGTAANGVQSESTAKTKTSGSGKVEMEMSNGRSRALIKPVSPVINLSSKASDTIDASKTVSISFKVLEAGNVTEIKISPESVLSTIVRDEIKEQLSQWLFEAADYTATANFEYKIIKR